MKWLLIEVTVVLILAVVIVVSTWPKKRPSDESTTHSDANSPTPPAAKPNDDAANL